MKIIFLDIDGVLNPVHNMNALHKMWKVSEGKIKSKDDYGYFFLDHNVNALAHIIELTQAKIVLSSTWRLMGEIRIRQLWDHRKLPGELYSVTPSTNEAIRGKEIDMWLNSFKEEGITSYVIIDDDRDMLPEQSGKFVKTNSYYGLTMADATKAIEILNHYE